MSIKNIGFVLLLVVLTGCSFQKGHTSYKVSSLMNHSQRLHAEGKLYIAMPRDFAKGADVADGTGKLVQEALQQAVGEFTEVKASAPAPEELTQILEAAKAQGCSYAVLIEILDWYDPPASFQISSDRGEVLVSVYDVESGKKIRMDNVTCNGSATTINLIGSYTPQDCLRPAFKHWGQKVFSR